MTNYKVSNNLANAMTKLVAADALPRLLGSLVTGNLVKRNFEPVVEEIGTRIESSFLIPNVTKILAVPDLLRLYMEPAIAALKEKIESDIFRLMIQSKELVAGYKFNRDDVYIISTPSMYQQLRQDPSFFEWRSAGEAGLRAMIDGPVGFWNNRYVMMSNDLNDFSVEFTKSAVEMQVRRVALPRGYSEYSEIGNFGMAVSMDYDPFTLSQKFTLHVCYTVALTGAGHVGRRSLI